MTTATKREDMNIVIVGHVDHGKSTVIGRLLADTDSLPEGKLDAIRELCRRNSKPFEYAFLLDALKDERAQGITIDAARCFFKTAARDYTILDAPGHIEFLRNMVTGAARAQAALLVIDAKEGVRENSRRHGYMLSILGIRQIAVVINKMDLVGFSREVFEQIKAEYTDFLERLGIAPKFVLPVSAFCGDNIRAHGENMPWYDGTTILETLDLFENERDEVHHFFRMPVQDVYKFTSDGDDRRIVAGTIRTGSVRPGDAVVFYPSGKTSPNCPIETFP
ncbi:MAG: GTP-binding protein, partial [Oscillospiraceae bacterium]|nr:GTP-binding protein [Oscillospiraceae bacterium]